MSATGAVAGSALRPTQGGSAARHPLVDRLQPLSAAHDCHEQCSLTRRDRRPRTPSAPMPPDDAGCPRPRLRIRRPGDAPKAASFIRSRASLRPLSECPPHTTAPDSLARPALSRARPSPRGGVHRRVPASDRNAATPHRLAARRRTVKPEESPRAQHGDTRRSSGRLPAADEPPSRSELLTRRVSEGEAKGSAVLSGCSRLRGRFADLGRRPQD